MTDDNLRDTFAAAALTGILANEGEGGSLSGTCQWAYRIADAMLRERAKTNHDAAPAARASEADRSPDQSQRGTGDTSTTHATPGKCASQGECTEPVAWLVEGGGYEYVSLLQENADAAASFESGCRVVPLYRSPTLTDDERESMEQREPSAPSRGSVANHDAVPAAIARVDSVAPQPTAHGTGNTPREAETAAIVCEVDRESNTWLRRWWR